MNSYELAREERIAFNKKRMDEMMLVQLANSLTQSMLAKKAAQKAPRKPRSVNVDLIAVPARVRRSTRVEGKPAVNYSDNVLDLADGHGSRKARQASYPAGSVEEKYTQEHVDALGSYDTEWELFKDGYGADGNRIYDKITGMTCHQCRQKTVGKHTSCSCCQSLQGVLCGDCLFMRYGENIDEVSAKPAWTCPVCRDLCNCSIHRVRRGWMPTGTLYRKAIALGYKSVAHFLVNTHLATKEPAEASDTETAEPSATAAAGALEASSSGAEEMNIIPEEPLVETAALPEPQEVTKPSLRKRKASVAVLQSSKRGTLAAMPDSKGKAKRAGAGISAAKLVGTAVQRKLTSRRSLSGKVASYASATDSFVIVYSNGQTENLTREQVTSIL